MTTLRVRAIVFASVLLLACAAAASAQQAPPPTAPPAPGPLVLEPMHNGFVLAPEIKVTRFDDKTGTLAGGYGGWVKDDHLFIGGGAYGLVDRKKDERNLAYGGFVIGWFFNPDQPISVSAKTLAGFGQFSRSYSVDVPFCALPEKYLCSRMPVRYPDDFDRHLRLHNTFLVAEPEVDVLVRLGRRARISAGVGYRLTDDREPFERGAHGITGAFSVQFNF